MTRKRKALQATESDEISEVANDPSEDESSLSVDLGDPQEAEEVSFEDLIEDLVSEARFVRASGVMMAVIHYPGGRLPPPLDRYPNGKGGYTHYGVAFIKDYRIRLEPAFVSPSMTDAMAVLAAVKEQQDQTWAITQAKASLEEEEETTPRSRRRTSPDDGDGSSQPDDSSARRTGGSRRIASLARSRRSKTTSRRR